MSSIIFVPLRYASNVLSPAIIRVPPVGVPSTVNTSKKDSTGSLTVLEIGSSLQIHVAPGIDAVHALWIKVTAGANGPVAEPTCTSVVVEVRVIVEVLSSQRSGCGFISVCLNDAETALFSSIVTVHVDAVPYSPHAPVHPVNIVLVSEVAVSVTDVP